MRDRTDAANTTAWRDRLAHSYTNKNYARAIQILNNHGYRVYGNSPVALKFAVGYASRQSARNFESDLLDHLKYKSATEFASYKRKYGASTSIGGVPGASRNPGKQPSSRPGHPTTSRPGKGNGKGNGKGGSGGGGSTDTTPGVDGPTSSAPVDWRQFMINKLQTPAQYAKSMADLEFNGALRDITRLAGDEKRRGRNIDSWVNKGYDPIIQGARDARANVDTFGAAQQGNIAQMAGTAADLFGVNQGAAAASANDVVQSQAGQLAALTQLQHAQNTSAITGAERMKGLRRDELTDRSKDQLNMLRDKMLGLRADKRAKYNAYLMDAQNMRQQAIAKAVDIAGALQNQNLAQAMSGYQLQQAALDTQGMIDQLGYNRKQQTWTDRMNQAGLDNLTEQGGKSAFVPWANIAEGDRRTLAASIIEPWMGEDANGMPALTTTAAKAKAMILQQLAAAGYAVKKNKNIGQWLDAYLATIPGGGSTYTYNTDPITSNGADL